MTQEANQLLQLMSRNGWQTRYRQLSAEMVGKPDIAGYEQKPLANQLFQVMSRYRVNKLFLYKNNIMTIALIYDVYLK